MITKRIFIFYLALSIVISGFLSGCGPTIKEGFYIPNLNCVEKQKPVKQQRVAVLNIEDNRPFTQKINVPAVLLDVFLVPFSLGLICLFYTMPRLNYHAMKNLDTDVPDYLAECLDNANLFQDVTRIDASSSDAQARLSQLNAEGFDYVLAGEISNFDGDYETEVIESVQHYPYVTETHRIDHSYGLVDTKWRLVNTKTGEQAWAASYETKQEARPDLQSLSTISENKLAVAALESAIKDVVRDLKGVEDPEGQEAQTAILQ